MQAESIKYTGFHTFCGSFTYKKMPMGLKCASATCQKLLNMELRGTHRFTGSLIDDILVFSMEFDQHLKHIQEVLERLRQARLTVNTKNASLWRTIFWFWVSRSATAEFILTKPRFRRWQTGLFPKTRRNWNPFWVWLDFSDNLYSSTRKLRTRYQNYWGRTNPIS